MIFWETSFLFLFLVSYIEVKLTKQIQYQSHKRAHTHTGTHIEREKKEEGGGERARVGRECGREEGWERDRVMVGEKGWEREFREGGRWRREKESEKQIIESGT